jgi:hypothetical protein
MDLTRKLPDLSTLPSFEGDTLQILGSLPLPEAWKADIEYIAQERAARGRTGGYRQNKVRDETKQLSADRKGAAAEYVVREVLEAWGITNDLDVRAAAFLSDAPVCEGDIALGEWQFDVKGAAGRVPGIQDREDRFVTVNANQNDVKYQQLGIRGYIVGRLSDPDTMDLYYVSRAAVAKCDKKEGTTKGKGAYYEVPLPVLTGRPE